MVVLVEQVCSFLAGARAPTLLALHMLRYEHLRLYAESLAVAISMLLLVLMSPIDCSALTSGWLIIMIFDKQ